MAPKSGTIDGLPRLMLVTDRHLTGRREMVDLIAACAQAGLRLVQVRELDLPGRGVFDLVQDLKGVLPPGVLLLVNGRPDIARETGSGLHLPAAMPHPGEELPTFWGRSCHDPAEARRAVQEGARYLVTATIFPTPTKPGFPGHGLELVRRLSTVAPTVPVFAIGGVDRARIESCRKAGAYGVAVRRAILSASDPVAATRELLAEL